MPSFGVQDQGTSSSSAPSPTTVIPTRVIAAEALLAAEAAHAAAALADAALCFEVAEAAAAAAAAATEEAQREGEEDMLRMERAHELRRHASSRRLQQCWRLFVRKRRTTAALAATFVEAGVTGGTGEADAVDRIQ